MTLSTGIPIPNSRAGLRARAFTLVELILVMALIVVTVSLVMPAMTRFFAGRTLDSEVKKFMALMHYGQTRAVSEGVPTMLWVDPDRGSYGLQQEGAFGFDQKAIENKLAKGLTISVARSNVRPGIANSQTGRILTGQTTQKGTKRAAIYFEPDGTINAALSASSISIQDGKNATVWFAPSPDADYEYVLQTTDPKNRRR
jgi:Tfp pilus assembly protein FimT